MKVSYCHDLSTFIPNVKILPIKKACKQSGENSYRPCKKHRHGQTVPFMNHFQFIQYHRCNRNFYPFFSKINSFSSISTVFSSVFSTICSNPGIQYFVVILYFLCYNCLFLSPDKIKRANTWISPHIGS